MSYQLTIARRFVAIVLCAFALMFIVEPAYAQSTFPILDRIAEIARAIFSPFAVVTILAVAAIVCLIGWAIFDWPITRLIKIAVAAVAIGVIDAIIGSLLRAGGG